MAAPRGSARRYADAAFEIAERDGTLDAWVADLDAAAAALGEGDAMRVLANPSLPVAERVAIAEQALDGRIGDKPRNLVLLLIRRGRIEWLAAVAAELHRLADRKAGIVEATVTSAVPLDDDEIEALRDRLGPLAGGTIHMERLVDPSILGGVIVRLGDRLIDGSVRGRLERLRVRLASGAR